MNPDHTNNSKHGPHDDDESSYEVPYVSNPRPRAKHFDSQSSYDLSKSNQEPVFLVNQILVERQPALVATPYKTLKTSICIDLAVAMDRGWDFLGRFPVLTGDFHYDEARGILLKPIRDSRLFLIVPAV